MVHHKYEYSKDITQRILQDYIDKIFAFALKRTMNREDAEDLSHDIVFEVLRSSASLKDEKAFRGWLWSIAKNTWKRWIYKKTKHPAESFDGLNMALFDDNASFEDAVIVKEDINLLRREIALLSQIQRDVTVLYYIEEKSCKEIATLMNISMGMVKQHLYKARKIIKEGVNMVREFGEKSYNPKDFVFIFWGELATMYHKMFERKLPKNIVMSAYQKPITIEEMSIDIGIPRPYLEDEVKILLDGDVLVLNKDGTYQTNFIIVLKELHEKVDKVLTDMCQPLAEKLLESLNKSENEIRNIGFIGSDYKWEKLLWIFIPLSMFLAMNRIQSEKLQEWPLLKTGIRGWASAIERKPEEWDYGVYYHTNLDNKLGYLSFDYRTYPKQISGILGPNDTELELLKKLYDRERYISDFNEKESEILATLIGQGFVKKENHSCIPNFIGLDSQSIKNVIDLENRDRAFVYNELSQMLVEIIKLFKREVPKHLTEQIEARAFVSLGAINSHVMKYLNNKGVLSIPSSAERNTTAFFMLKNC